MRLVAPVVAVLSAAAVLAGCSSPPSRLTATELAARANEICRAAGQPYGGLRPSEPRAFVRFLLAQLPAQRHGLTSLKSLRPPAAAEADWTSMVISPEDAQLADEVNALSQLQALIAKGDLAAAGAVVLATTGRLDTRGEGINRYWNKAGATACQDSPL